MTPEAVKTIIEKYGTQIFGEDEPVFFEDALYRHYFNYTSFDERKFFIEAGMPVNFVWKGYMWDGSEGITPLILALRKAHATTDFGEADFLFSRGADVNQVVIIENPKWIDEEEAEPEEVTAIGTMVAIHSMAGLEWLIEHGAKPTDEDVIMAALCYPEAVKLLLENGGNVFATNAQGMTLAHNIAIGLSFNSCYDDFNDEGYVEAMKLVLSSGVDFNATDKNGRTVTEMLEDENDICKTFLTKINA